MTATDTVIGVGRGVGTLGLVAASLMTIYLWAVYWLAGGGVGVATDAVAWTVLGILLFAITAGFERLDKVV